MSILAENYLQEPILGSRHNINFPLNWNVKNGFSSNSKGWKMKGYYQSGTSSLGNSRLILVS